MVYLLGPDPWYFLWTCHFGACLLSHHGLAGGVHKGQLRPRGLDPQFIAARVESMQATGRQFARLTACGQPQMAICSCPHLTALIDVHTLLLPSKGFREACTKGVDVPV